MIFHCLRFFCVLFFG